VAAAACRTKRCSSIIVDGSEGVSCCYCAIGILCLHDAAGSPCQNTHVAVMLHSNFVRLQKELDILYDSSEFCECRPSKRAQAVSTHDVYNA